MTVILKNSKQIDGIRNSCKLAARTLKFIEPFIVPGASTVELDDLMANFIKENGATSACLGYNGNNPKQIPYPKSTCISVNDVICHGIPNETKLKEGDIVCVDVTTILNGYYGDTAYTFSVGNVSEDAKHLLEVSKQCLGIGIKKVKPGILTGEIGYSISRYAWLQGCSVVENYCGHGVGSFFHEPPQICHKAEKHEGIPMIPGMTFTIEPMINLGSPDTTVDLDGWTVRTVDGSLSAQYEHTILVTNDGYEILTLWT